MTHSGSMEEEESFHQNSSLAQSPLETNGGPLLLESLGSQAPHDRSPFEVEPEIPQCASSRQEPYSIAAKIIDQYSSRPEIDEQVVAKKLNELNRHADCDSKIRLDTPLVWNFLKSTAPVDFEKAPVGFGEPLRWKNEYMCGGGLASYLYLLRYISDNFARCMHRQRAQTATLTVTRARLTYLSRKNCVLFSWHSLPVDDEAKVMMQLLRETRKPCQSLHKLQHLLLWSLVAKLRLKAYRSSELYQCLCIRASIPTCFDSKVVRSLRQKIAKNVGNPPLEHVFASLYAFRRLPDSGRKSAINRHLLNNVVPVIKERIASLHRLDAKSHAVALRLKPLATSSNYRVFDTDPSAFQKDYDEDLHELDDELVQSFQQLFPLLTGFFSGITDTFFSGWPLLDDL